jgi:hypothetical protein
MVVDWNGGVQKVLTGNQIGWPIDFDDGTMVSGSCCIEFLD